MKKICTSISLVLTLGICAQDPLILGPENLVQLKKPHTVLNKYVNFDVLKIMIGSGAATNSFDYSINMSTRFQFLNPYAFSKRYFKIAYGITYGTNRIRAPKTRVNIQNQQQVTVEEDNFLRMSMIRTRSIGFIFLRVFRMGNTTLLLGPSAEYNLTAHLRTKNLDKAKERYSIKNVVNKVSVPLNIQFSISKKQFLAFGVFGRYDLRPLFKSPQLKKVRLFTVGLSGSVII